MSAIFGIASLSGRPVNNADVTILDRALEARAPDNCDWWRSPGSDLVLGCRLLGTTPESLRETQPWRHGDSGCVIVADARLDNRADLKHRLALRDGALTDSELILRAYLRWGETCPESLLGDFAFCIHDPGKGGLFLARDHLGAKSFYFASNVDYFAFASTPESLLPLPWVDTALNDEVLANLFVYKYPVTDDLSTWYRDISGVLPGTALFVNGENGRVATRRYWAPARCDVEPYTDAGEAREAFREVFTHAVSDRLRGSHPPALMLSGGMDSASIAAAAEITRGNNRQAPFDTYSVLADDTADCIESQCILTLTGKACFNPRYLRVPSVSGMLDPQQLFHLAWDDPHPVDNDLLIQSAMLACASRDGHSGILHGTTGDLTTWSSRQYIAAHFRGGRLATGIRESFAASDHHTYYYGISPFHILLQNLYHAFAPGWLKRLYQRRFAPTAPEFDLGFLNTDFARKMRMQERLAEINDTYRQLSLTDAYWRDLLNFINAIPSGLGGANRLASRHGIEPRDPFGDRRVVDFFMGLPQEFKVRDGWTKYLPRTAFADRLPGSVRFRRSKESLGRSIHLSALNHSPEFLEDVIANMLPALYPYLDRKYVDGTVESHRRGDSLSSRRLYDLLTWALWINRTNRRPGPG